MIVHSSLVKKLCCEWREAFCGVLRGCGAVVKVELGKGAGLPSSPGEPSRRGGGSGWGLSPASFEAARLHRRLEAPQLKATLTCPQGSVIPRTLFNSFVSNYPYNVQIYISYADDVLPAHSSLNPQEAADALNVHAK